MVLSEGKQKHLQKGHAFWGLGVSVISRSDYSLL